MTSITLLEALNRILASTAVNEGPDAKCAGSDLPLLKDPVSYSVKNMIGSLAASGSNGITFRGVRSRLFLATPVRVARKLRNWEIVDATTCLALLRQHPWDDTKNVAKLGTRLDPAHIESLVQFSSRVQELANEAERLRQFVIAQNLWATVAVINRYTGQPIENAIREERRLAEVVAALVAVPPRA